jgi:hypothetical protein
MGCVRFLSFCSGIQQCNFNGVESHVLMPFSDFTHFNVPFAQIICTEVTVLP